jgi:hypothetical protein
MENLMRDASEYQFTAGERRVTVRQAVPAESAADLTALATEYVDRCELFLGASYVAPPALGKTPHGADTATLTATLPDGRLRVALLRFAAGPVVELVLASPADDAGADAEFARLLASARPSSATPTEAVARALAAGPRATPASPVGPLLLDLPVEYAAHSQFALESVDGRERFQLTRSAADTGVTRAGLIAPYLASGIGSVVGEDGRTVRFETITPRRYTRKAVTESLPMEAEVMRGNDKGEDGASGPSVAGTVHGVTLRVLLYGDAATPENAVQLLKDLQAAK